MGLTPLEGLVMGTRSGDIDPAIIEFIAHKEGKSIDEIMNMPEQGIGRVRPFQRLLLRFPVTWRTLTWKEMKTQPVL